MENQENITDISNIYFYVMYKRKTCIFNFNTLIKMSSLHFTQYNFFCFIEGENTW